MAMSTGEKAAIAILVIGTTAGAGYYLYLKSLYNAYAIAEDGSIFVKQTGPHSLIVGLNPSSFQTNDAIGAIDFYQIYVTDPSGHQSVLQTTQPYSSAPGQITITEEDINGQTWLVSSPIQIETAGLYEFSGEKGVWILEQNATGMADLGKTSVVAIDIKNV